MAHKIWMSTGGTGGHLFPALALAAELKARDPTTQILFLGGGLASSRYFDRDLYPYLEVCCESLAKKTPWALLRSGSRILRGVWQAHRAIRSQRPDLLVGFGSFYSLPPLLAARLAGVPLILHAADALPGRVIRLMSRYAALTVLQFPEAAKHIQGRSEVARMPLRGHLKKGGTTQADARLALGLRPERRTLLVFGGSQGARRINQLVSQAVVSQALDLQLLHYTGDAASAEQLQNFYRNHGVEGSVKGFEPRMDLAWEAADLVIGRSGASTIAELCEYEVPGLLIPYPYATDNHQEKNADALATRTGGVIRLREADLTVETLSQQLVGLLEGDATGLRNMQRALAQSKAERSTLSLSDLVWRTL